MNTPEKKGPDAVRSSRELIGLQKSPRVKNLSLSSFSPFMARTSSEQNAPGSPALVPPFFRDVKSAYADEPERYRSFIELMKGYKTKQLTTGQVAEQAGQLFHDRPELIEGFNQFLPRKHKIVLSNVSSPASSPYLSRAADASTNATPPKPMRAAPKLTPAQQTADSDEEDEEEESSDDGGTKTLKVRAITANDDRNSTSNFALQVSDESSSADNDSPLRGDVTPVSAAPPPTRRPSTPMASYFADVKSEFSDSPETYSEFLRILKNFNEKTITPRRVAELIGELFKGRQHLLMGFNQYLPEKYRFRFDDSGGAENKTAEATPKVVATAAEDESRPREQLSKEHEEPEPLQVEETDESDDDDDEGEVGNSLPLMSETGNFSAFLEPSVTGDFETDASGTGTFESTAGGRASETGELYTSEQHEDESEEPSDRGSATGTGDYSREGEESQTGDDRLRSEASERTGTYDGRDTYDDDDDDDDDEDEDYDDEDGDEERASRFDMAVRSLQESLKQLKEEINAKSDTAIIRVCRTCTQQVMELLAEDDEEDDVHEDIHEHIVGLNSGVMQMLKSGYEYGEVNGVLGLIGELEVIYRIQ